MQQIAWIYEEHKQELYSYLLWLTHDTTLAEDLLQETFVQAISSLERFRKESSVRTWLFSIARHLWMKHLRDRKPAPLPEEILFNLSEDTLQKQFSDRQILKRVEQLLAQKDARAGKSSKCVHMDTVMRKLRNMLRSAKVLRGFCCSAYEIG